MERNDLSPDVYGVSPCKVQWKTTSEGESDDASHEFGEDCDDFGHSVISEVLDDITNTEFAKENRISQVLRGWMPDYILHTIEPSKDVSDKELLYSAKLGIEPRIKRIPSCESLVTELSLLSCSTLGKNTKAIGKKRRKKPKGSRPETCNSSTVSKWVALANRKHGAFDTLLKQQSSHAPMGNAGGLDNIAFDMMDADEKKMLYKCGHGFGINMAPGLKKSGSNTNIFTKDFRLTNNRRYSNPGSMLISPKRKLLGVKTGVGVQGIKVSMLDSTTSRTTTPQFNEKVKMWQTDDHIFDTNLNQGMSAKVRDRIASTTKALERASRQNTTRPKSTPGCIRTNPNNPQNVKISPELSNIIKDDIKLRMGRPRHHEIKQKDVQNWSRDYNLDRSHRNLKVFNWLHSLKEEEFQSSDNKSVSETSKDRSFVEFVHIDSVDEPFIKPLNFNKLKREYTVY